MQVHHPRFPVIPLIGMSAAPGLLHRAMRPVLRRLLVDGCRPDLIDAHYFYPDGVAAVRLGREFGLPAVVTSRGTDVNLIPQYAGPRRMLRRAVSQAADRRQRGAAAALHELGAPEGRVRVLRNGVDTAISSRPSATRPARR